MYYRESLEALQMLMQNPAHLEAKAAQSNWLDGYQVTISRVIRTDGDARLAHPLTGRHTGRATGDPNVA
ncbi:hypothetical protein BGLA2_60106 [Burkholderia gladioli]|nr:hypothetical protein BGLA2_60106 [Burkholderia gladioli]